MIARVLWFALLAGVAVVAFGVQLDRQARKTPTIAASVPEVFRSSAQLPIAVYALDDDTNPDIALAEAERLVRRRPLPSEHLRVLAQAQFAAGMIDESALTIQYAAQRGWRDPLAQEAMLRLALEAGDEAEAARRYTALFLRRDTTDDLLTELGASVLATPGGAGRQALVDIVAGGERWNNRFLQRGMRVIPADAFAEIISKSVAAGARFDCSTLRQAEGTITAKDAAAGAQIGAAVADQC